MKLIVFNHKEKYVNLDAVGDKQGIATRYNILILQLVIFPLYPNDLSYKSFVMISDTNSDNSKIRNLSKQTNRKVKYIVCQMFAFNQTSTLSLYL